jgi:hypothetical protein
MSAFYIMKYAGQAGVGGGTIYIGKGFVAGVDVQGGRIDGTYTIVDGRMRGAIKITAPSQGMNLVTGQRLPGGVAFDLNFDFPAETFDDGTPRPMTGLEGRPLHVAFEKVRDLPG